MNLGVRDSWLALPASPTPTVEVPMNDTTPNPALHEREWMRGRNPPASRSDLSR